MRPPNFGGVKKGAGGARVVRALSILFHFSVSNWLTFLGNILMIYNAR